MSSIHVVLPNDIDDPATPSGGNIYDRRVCQGLAAGGWSIHEHAVAGAWPHPDATARGELSRRLAALPDGAIVLLDGLVASAVPRVLAPHASRLRLAIVMHMPLGDGSLGDGSLRRRKDEQATLGYAQAIVATSEWTRRRVLELYRLPAQRLHVAPPGVDAAPVATGSAAGGGLLCVGAVTPQKGYDLLTESLAMVADLPWRCLCVGSLSRDPAFVGQLRRQTSARGLDGRVCYVGPRIGDELDAAYAGADLLVLASRGESYGMVVVEALARAIPVLATDANGVAEAMGQAPTGQVPGLLVSPGDPAALASALRAWLSDGDLRRGLRSAAAARRTTLIGWGNAVDKISTVLHSLVSSR